jgi:hypothetical protein
VKSSYAEAQSLGINTGELRSLRRNFEHPEGWTQPAFSLFSPDADDIEGLMHVVVIQHLTPELIRRPDFLEHANGCIGISAMSGAISDVRNCAVKMRRLLGDAAVNETDDGVVLTVPSGQVIRLDKGETAGLESMTMRVTDIRATAEFFEHNGITCNRDADGSVAIAPADACGTRLIFAEAT